MTTYPRDRFGYSSPFTRPPLKLPGKGRIIIWSVVNIEEWEITRPMARQLSQPPMGQTPIPDGVKVLEGDHKVRLYNHDLKKETIKRVLIRAGQRETVKVNFQDE